MAMPPATSGDGIHVVGNGNTVALEHRLRQRRVTASTSPGNIQHADHEHRRRLGQGQPAGRRHGSTGYAATRSPATRRTSNGGIGFEISGGTVGYGKPAEEQREQRRELGSGTENTGAEYSLLNYVKNNAGGNKADNIVVPKTAAPTKCTAFPTT